MSTRGARPEAAEAPPIELIGGPPIPAEARAELLVIKSEAVFLCAHPGGDIRSETLSGEGLYTRDTRHLSELRVTLGDVGPVLLSHSVESGYRAVVNATNPAIADAGGVSVPQETLNLRRTLVISDRLHCLIELHNYRPHPVSVPLALALAADFADVFEIRGVGATGAGTRSVRPELGEAQVSFSCRGRDGTERETIVQLEPPPHTASAEGGRARLGWTIELAAGEQRDVLFTVLLTQDRRRPQARPLPDALAALEQEEREFTASCTHVRCDSQLFQSVIDASVRDVHALLTPAGEGRLPAGGIPWFVAAFGRDSLLTCHECLMLNPALARDTLFALAALQARNDEPWRDAEPGKILHELRSGELARAGLIPHTPYYGTVDATPLFLLLAATYYRWTADLETLAALRGTLDAALDWIDHHGDADGDGFVEYQRRSPAGLLNQGWKDSEDAVVGADGKLATGPIALVEVQGYTYVAKLRIAEVYDDLGEPERAELLRAQAEELRGAFNEAFWNPQEGTFALALDGAKRQVASVTSNPGHCLYCGIVDEDKGQAVAERLMAPDMFSGWGVRTLSAQSPAYNPMSYHNGSVWPHDNAIIAAGLKRYGCTEATMRIATAMFEVGAHSRDFRLAELYCGFERGSASSEIVSYPVACMPQAWAAAAPFMLLQAMLGITAHAPAKTLRVIQPAMPSWLTRAELRGLRVGAADVGLAFTQAGGVTGFSLLEQHGELTVTMAAAPAMKPDPAGAHPAGAEDAPAG